MVSGDMSTISLEHARAILSSLKQDPSVGRKIRDLHEKLINEEVGRRLQVLKSGQPAAPLAICVDCKEAFDPQTSIGAIAGNLEPDYDGDFWADHDEDCHGIIDTDEMREEYPEGFTWDCCDQAGDAEGCHRGFHRADDDGEKEGVSVEFYESTEEEDDDDDDDEDEEDEDEEDETKENKDDDPEVVVVGERQVVNKRKADDSFEVSVYAQKPKRDAYW
ncbi:hypothetical protein CKAH01_13027 [Colletotrichum kahawae]|uniref:Uncharacterized protein n=1 Tax=Colletotrichum kahawae TaxID=34407 RepID=A0AAE0DEF7_COLKA|nr:hypothetical protein CKAH01_13027 [Colletotrichum kahawae]